MIIKQEFDYNGDTKDLQYEIYRTIYPNSFGDYDLIELDSAGNFNILEEIRTEDVEIIQTNSVSKK